jgi:hypothetical protein
LNHHNTHWEDFGTIMLKANVFRLVNKGSCSGLNGFVIVSFVTKAVAGTSIRSSMNQTLVQVME